MLIQEGTSEICRYCVIQDSDVDGSTAINVASDATGNNEIADQDTVCSLEEGMVGVDPCLT